MGVAIALSSAPGRCGKAKTRPGPPPYLPLVRIAVISDVHARPERARAALTAARAEGAEEIWCLGDLISYGKEPAEAVRAVREGCDLVLAGNHDAAITGALPHFLDVIPDWLRATLELARRELEACGDLEWLGSLRPAERRRGICAYHASHDDPYLGTADADELCARDQLARQPGRLAIVGHSHRPVAIGLRDGQIAAYEPGHGDQIDLRQAERWILNPGTCGLRQREGVRDRRSGWMLLDDAERTATWYRL